MRYTCEMMEWLKGNIKAYPYKELTEKFNKKFETNVSQSQLQDACFRHGLRNNRGCGLKTEKLGKIRVTKKGVAQIKVRNGESTYNWMLLSNYLWEKEYGSIPDDRVVIFIDDNKMHCDVSNLYLIDRKLLLAMRRLKLSWWDMESLEVAMNVARLKALVRGLKK